MAAAKIKKGDQVIVLAGRDKGKKGEVYQVMPREGRALVRGVNMVRRNQRQSPSQPTKVGFKVLNDGRKVRIAKRSGEEIAEKR